MMAGCSADINPQPEPPGFNLPPSYGNAGGSTGASAAGGAGFVLGTGGIPVSYVGAGGASSGDGANASGGASTPSAGDAGLGDAGGDGGGYGGLGADAGVRCSADASTDAMPDASANGCSPLGDVGI